MLHGETTERIICAFYKVYNTLGYGFLEKVYENALAMELRNQGMDVAVQRNVKVFYEGEEVGDYYADMIVDGSVIVELKCAETLCTEHRNQLINYLRATEMEVGLLLNFGKEPQFSRVVFSNKRKRIVERATLTEELAAGK